ncbi:hypothetical protein [Kitasatospora sp. P5_F3]
MGRRGQRVRGPGSLGQPVGRHRGVDHQHHHLAADRTGRGGVRVEDVAAVGELRPVALLAEADLVLLPGVRLTDRQDQDGAGAPTGLQ